MHLADYLIIIFFLGLMVFIGLRCRNASENFGDYVRMGSRSPWWLAGSSIFMMTFSAITFTGICGSAYVAGWSVLVIFWCNALIFLIQALIFAPLLRRTRADTPQDTYRLRFGTAVEQLLSYLGPISGFVWGGTFLLSLATFVAVVFDLPVWVVIVVVGTVVVFYSVAGGSWSVQITDALQAIILLPVTIAFAGLCLYKIGGVSGLLEGIESQGLTEDFALVKPPGHEYSSKSPVQPGMFTGLWVVAMVMKSMVDSASLGSSFRYLSLKDERGARKAAALAAVLMVAGSLIWFIPPMVGRLLFSAEIESVEGLGNQADGAYAMTALNLLPPGFVGLIVVAMLAATMSSMDSFLTGTAATMVKNIYIPAMRFFGKAPRAGGALLSLTRRVNFALGIWAIGIAFLLRWLSVGGGIFGIIMTVFAMIMPPLTFPVALGLIIRRMPLWGFFSGVGVGVCATVTIFTLEKQGHFFPWHEKIFYMSAASLLPPLFSTFFWKYSSPKYQRHVSEFFELIKRPIIVDDEVKTTVDGELLRTVGRYTLVSALAVGLLFIVSREPEGVVAVLSVSFFLFIVGGVMLRVGMKTVDRGE